MDIKHYKDAKLVTLSKAFDSKEKALYFFYFVVFFATACFFLRMLFFMPDAPLVGIVFCILAAFAFCLAAYRFLNKSLLSETLFVNKQVLQLCKKGVFGSLVKTYNVSDVSNFRHLKKPELTNHPLATQSFDYLGFQTEQKVISEMHGDNRLAFDWKGIPVVFGQDVFSWDFETLDQILFDLTGNDLKHTDKIVQIP